MTPPTPSRASPHRFWAAALLASAALAPSFAWAQQPGDTGKPDSVATTQAPVGQAGPTRLQVPDLQAPQGLLSGEQAFALQPPALPEAGSTVLPLQWVVAPGYYLYREQMQVRDAQGDSLALELPEGERQHDEFFGDVATFRHGVQGLLTLPQDHSRYPLQVQWQGCADVGVCYQPQSSTIAASVLQTTATDSAPAEARMPAQPAPAPELAPAQAAPSAHWASALRLPDSLAIGPLALPMGVLLVFAAYGLGLWVAARQQRRSGLPVESVFWRSALWGVLAARLAYVLQWWSQYTAPVDTASGAGAQTWAAILRMLDVRDGGLSLWPGLLAAVAYVAWRSRRQPTLRRAMVWTLGSAALVLVIGQGLRSLPAAQTTALPAFTLINGQAEPVVLAQLQGQPMVINLWASWCPPCQREMPVMLQAQKDNPHLRFIWINQGEDAATVMRYLQRQPLPQQQVLLDPEQRASAHWRQRGLPSTYFYDAQGRLQSTRMGELSRASLAQHMQGIALP